MAARLVLSMPFRASSNSSRSRNKSSHPIDDDIKKHYSNNNFSIDILQLWKETEEPEHEFIILITNDDRDVYRIERRPSKGTNIKSKLHGCKAEDTITHLDDQGWERVYRHADRKITQYFSKPKPDLYTIFAFCNAIRRDPDTEKYTLAEFNCYFFARTLALLIARYSLVRQYCVSISPRNDFSSLPGPEIDAIVDEAWNKMPPRPIRILIFDSKIESGETYKDLRLYILEVNKRHCKIVTQLGGKGDEVYDTLDKTMDEI